MAEGRSQITVECGYCLNKNEQLQDPRVLPCSHVLCKGCLEGYVAEHGVIDCHPCK